MLRVGSTGLRNLDDSNSNSYCYCHCLILILILNSVGNSPARPAMGLDWD